MYRSLVYQKCVYIIYKILLILQEKTKTPNYEFSLFLAIVIVSMCFCNASFGMIVPEDEGFLKTKMQVEQCSLNDEYPKGTFFSFLKSIKSDGTVPTVIKRTKNVFLFFLWSTVSTTGLMHVCENLILHAEANEFLAKSDSELFT